MKKSTWMFVWIAIIAVTASLAVYGSMEAQSQGIGFSPSNEVACTGEPQGLYEFLAVGSSRPVRITERLIATEVAKCGTDLRDKESQIYVNCESAILRDSEVQRMVQEARGRALRSCDNKVAPADYANPEGISGPVYCGAEPQETKQWCAPKQSRKTGNKMCDNTKAPRRPTADELLDLPLHEIGCGTVYTDNIETGLFLNYRDIGDGQCEYQCYLGHDVAVNSKTRAALYYVCDPCSGGDQ